MLALSIAKNYPVTVLSLPRGIMKLPKSCIEPPGPFAPKQVLQDFLARAKRWAKEDPDDLSVTWAIGDVKDSMARQQRRERGKTAATE